jgi:uncharacterized protein DUF6069
VARRPRPRDHLPGGCGRAPQTFTLPFLAGFTLQVALAGWVTLAILERYTRHAMGIWTALGVSVLALSFAPIALAGASAPIKAALSLIHLSVAGVLLVTMRQRRPGMTSTRPPVPASDRQGLRNDHRQTGPPHRPGRACGAAPGDAPGGAGDARSCSLVPAASRPVSAGPARSWIRQPVSWV